MTTTVNEPAATNAPPDLVASRKLTMKWIAIGWASFAVAMVTAWSVAPRAAPVAAPVDRLLLAAQLSAGVGFVIMCILQGLWRVQDTLEAENPFAGKESQGFKINQRVMTNTIEQAVMFMPVYLGLAVRMKPEQTYWLPLLMAFWCTARLMFWVGYRRALHLRAPGMDWTSGTAIVTAVLFVMTLL